MTEFISIHQPNYMPWCGFFYKILKSKNFIFLDDVLVSKQSYFSRVKVLENSKSSWLTIPAKIKFGMKINEVYPAENNWKKSHLSKIYNAYNNSKFFREIWKYIEEIYNINENLSISEINKLLVKQICNLLEIECSFFDSSKLAIDKNKTSSDRLIELVKKLNGRNYLSGNGGKNYQNINNFRNNFIELNYIKMLNLKYTQSKNNFEPGLSIIDTLFHLGKLETYNYIKNNFLVI